MGQTDPPTRPAAGMLRLLGRGDQQAAVMRKAAVQVATQQANRAVDTERELRRQQQTRASWLEANAHLGPACRQVIRELAWQRRAHGLAAEHEPPGWLREELGPLPASTRGQRAWRQAAAAIVDYRTSYHISDPDRPLGTAPRDPAQRAAYREVQQAIGRVHTKQRHLDRARNQQLMGPQPPTARGPQDPPTRPEHKGRGRAGPERAAG
jgi:hypothetical protein